jgi:hypothetical protein
MGRFFASRSPVTLCVNRGPRSVLICASHARAPARGAASLCVAKIRMRAVWSDQFSGALPNRARARRRGLNDCPVASWLLHSRLVMRRSATGCNRGLHERSFDGSRASRELQYAQLPQRWRPSLPDVVAIDGDVKGQGTARLRYEGITADGLYVAVSVAARWQPDGRGTSPPMRRLNKRSGRVSRSSPTARAKSAASRLLKLDFEALRTASLVEQNPGDRTDRCSAQRQAAFSRSFRPRSSEFQQPC